MEILWNYQFSHWLCSHEIGAHNIANKLFDTSATISKQMQRSPLSLLIRREHMESVCFASLWVESLCLSPFFSVSGATGTLGPIALPTCGLVKSECRSEM